MFATFEDLDASATLAAATSSVRARRAAEVEELVLLRHWARLHSADLTEGPDGEVQRVIGNTLVELGGDGTPGVQEFSLGEIALARETGWTATANKIGDVLDLVHRLPRVWEQVVELRCEPWLACKVARISRPLAKDQVHLVDRAVARAISTESPWAVIELAEAKVIEADPERHAEQVLEERSRRHVSLSRSDEFGLRHVIARVEAGDAAWIDATVQRVADILGEQDPTLRCDVRRSMAMGWLARPAELLELLLTHTADEADSDEEQPPAAPTGEELTLNRALALPADLLDALRSHDLEALRPSAVLYVHLHQLALEGRTSAVARIEDVGPALVWHATAMLRHANVRLTPVIDLHDEIQVSAYEHPESLKERVWLGSRGDYFPFAPKGGSRRVDFDHPVPFDPTGPPGQTGTHNSGPLSRRHHRWKTHAGYDVLQLGRSAYLWRTPHQRYYLVDHRGTREVAPDSPEIGAAFRLAA